MYKAVFKCETITPMFLSGADQSEAELRPPSIKGAMRYWWRAMNGDMDLKTLKEKESEIFGSSNEGGRRSKIIVKTRINEKKESKLDDNLDPGVAYLFYTTKKRKYIYADFDVIVTSMDENALVDASHAFIMLMLFGGLGSRSRRGGGNFIINNIETKDNVSKIDKLKVFFPLEKDKQGLIQQIKDIYIMVKKGSSANNYYKLNNASIHIYNGKKIFTEWDKALNYIGSQYQEFRLDRRMDDYDNIKNYLVNGDKIQYVRRTEFGLPIQFSFRSLAVPEDRKMRLKDKTIPKASIYALYYDEGEDKSINRLSSPLMLKVIKSGKNYYPLIIKFQNIMPINYKQIAKDITSIKQGHKVLYTKKEDNNEDVTAENTIIQEFIDSLGTNFSRII